jgi:hypothetical protein
MMAWMGMWAQDIALLLFGIGGLATYWVSSPIDLVTGLFRRNESMVVKGR